MLRYSLFLFKKSKTAELTSIVKEQSSKSWKSIGIQFNKSWNKISEIMNSTIRDPIGIDQNSTSSSDISDQILNEDSFDILNNDVVFPKPNHEYLQNQEFIHSVNNMTKLPDSANNIYSSSDKDSEIEEILTMSINSFSSETESSDSNIGSIQNSMIYIDAKYNKMI